MHRSFIVMDMNAIPTSARLRGYTMGAPSHHYGASTSSSVCEDNVKESDLPFAWSCCGARSKDNKVCECLYSNPLGRY